MAADHEFTLRFSVASPEAAKAADVAKVIADLARLYDASAEQCANADVDLRIRAVRSGSLLLECAASSDAGGAVTTRLLETIGTGAKGRGREEREAYAALFKACEAIAAPEFKRGRRVTRAVAPVVLQWVEVERVLYGRVSGVWERAGGVSIELRGDGASLGTFEVEDKMTDRAHGLWRKTVRAKVVLRADGDRRTNGRVVTIDRFEEQDPILMLTGLRRELKKAGGLVSYDDFVEDRK